MTATLATDAANGHVTINPDGSFSYTPNHNFTGTDTFQYTITDNYGATTTQTVQIQVSDNAPTVTSPSVTIVEDTQTTIPLAALGSDTNGNPITISSLGTPSHGQIVQNADGSLTYTPTVGFAGTDTVTYTLNDQTLDSPVGTITFTVTDPGPVGTTHTYVANENTPVSFDATAGVLKDATDAAGNTMTATLATDGANGHVTINPDGSFSYTPNHNFTGTDTFQYTITDNYGATTTQTVQIQVSDNAPTVTSPSVTIVEDTQTTIPLAALGSDTNGNPITISSLGTPSHGQMVQNADGSLTYTPDIGFAGTDTVTYTINDQTLDSPVGTITFTVTDPGPVGTTHTYVANENTPVSFDATSGVLKDATDAAGNTMTATLATDAANGHVTINTDGSFSYTPNHNFTGTDTFQYTITDNYGATTTQTVQVQVNDNAPTVTSPSVTIVEDTQTTIPLAALGSDTNGNPITISSLGTPSHGQIVQNADGSLTYTPTVGFAGTDTVTYTLNDQTLDSPVGTITFTVTDPGPVGTTHTYVANENTPVSFDATAGVLKDATDAAGNTMTATLATDAANGHVTINTDGSFSYTPNHNFTGTDTFQYTITDNYGATTTQTVQIQVYDNAPTVTSPSVTIVEDTQTTIPLAALGSDTNGNPITISSLGTPSHGQITQNADGSLTYTPTVGFAGTDTVTYTLNDQTLDSAQGTITFTVTDPGPVGTTHTYVANENTPVSFDATAGVLKDATDAAGNTMTATLATDGANGHVTINPDGSFSYTPNHNFTGTDTFQYTITDNYGATTTQTVQIQVSDNAPTVTSPSVTIVEDTQTTIPLAALGSDTNGNPITISSLGTPSHGQIVQNADGSLTYTPDIGFAGTDTVTYTINDQTLDSPVGTITFTVTDPGPVGTTHTYVANENTPVSFDATAGVLKDATDAAGNTMTATLATDGANGHVTINTDGSFSYTPNHNFTGTDTFQYTITDNYGATTTQTVQIQVSDNAPTVTSPSVTIVEDTQTTIPLAALGSDTNGNPITISSLGTPSHGQIVQNADGSLTYTPTVGFAGTDTVTYTLNDQTLDSPVGTITFTVTDPGPVGTTHTYVANENTPVSFDATAGVLKDATDAAGNTMTATLATDAANGHVTINPDGSFSYTPNHNFTGTDTFQYTITDNYGATTTQTVQIQVNDNAPTVTSPSVTIVEDTQTTIPLAALGSDTNGNPITISSLGTPSHGQVVQNADGSITYTPDIGFAGTDTVTYTINDQTLDSPVRNHYLYCHRSRSCWNNTHLRCQ